MCRLDVFRFRVKLESLKEEDLEFALELIDYVLDKHPGLSESGVLWYRNIIYKLVGSRKDGTYCSIL